MQIIELRNQYDIAMLTLKAQNKGKKMSNEDIYNNIIKKENGVNPFLTVMNFRVSFKTWIKHARKKLKEFRKYRAKEYGEEEYYDNYTTQIDEDNKQTYRVEIDVEIFNEYTSDEDSQAELESKGTLKHGQSTMSIGSGSKGKGLGQSQAQRERKKKDHLALFEKKMTQKFKKLGTGTSAITNTGDVTLMKSGR
jgi:hypothetical protein